MTLGRFLMDTVEVFDPPMCCSTGVCGPSVDPALATFAADLTWLADQGATVERHNLSQEPKAFAERDLIRGLLAERGEDALPAVVVAGELRSSGRYPTRTELVEWSLGGAASDSLDDATTELVAIGAAVGANCEPCFKFHYNEARRLGVGSGAMVAAVRVAQAVKDTPARSMLDLAAKLLGTDNESLRPTDPGHAPLTASALDTGDAPATGADEGCCGGGKENPEVTATDVAPPASSGCCGGDAVVTEVPLVTTATGTSGCCG
jgi:AhpD family alkylhydroperoxidase